MAQVTCIQCGEKFDVRPARLKTAKFCSYACRGAWRKVHWRGENHPNWTGGRREKVCKYCGKTFGLKPNQPITTFRKQKFCSKPCADKGGIRHEGEANPRWSPNARRRARKGKHAAWARAVVSRDNATCQHCGAQGVELHAHHIKSHRDYPELRWDLSNGLTLCHACHWQVHAASEANAVNSGDTLPDNAGGNPEPSFGRKPVEGVTTRGRAYRRWHGHCDWCGTFIVKQWSDAKGKKHLFCSKQCMGKHRFKHGGAFGRPRQ